MRRFRISRLIGWHAHCSCGLRSRGRRDWWVEEMLRTHLVPRGFSATSRGNGSVTLSGPGLGEGRTGELWLACRSKDEGS